MNTPFHRFNRFRMLARGRRHAFSLVELLCVLAVVAVLVAIILPSVSLIREKSHTTACVANLRQIGNAFNLYMVDHAGVAIESYRQSEKKSWYHYLLGRNVSGHIVGYSYLEDKSMPQCPSWSTNNPYALNGGYGMTDLMLWNPSRRVSKDTSFFSAKLLRPDDWPLIMDADHANIFSLDDPREEAGVNQRFDARHGGFANVLMADQHVEQVEYGDRRWSQNNLNDGTHF